MLVLIVARSSSALQSTLSGVTGERIFIVRGSGQGGGVAQAFWPRLLALNRQMKSTLNLKPLTINDLWVKTV